MKRLFLLFLVFFTISGFSQKTCFDDANGYRFSKLSESVDSLVARMEKAQSMVINCELPNDSFLLMNGKKVKISEYKGKPLIINFWYIYCPPCVNEIPSFNELAKKYADKINILAISKDHKKQIEEFLLKRPFNVDMVADREDYIIHHNIGAGYPCTIILDKEGKVVKFINGANPAIDHQMDLYKEISPLIDTMLVNKKN